MPAILNWLLRLIPTNPICMRLVQGGSRRLRHLYIRTGYLAIMIVVLLFVLLGNSTTSLSVRDLATSGATMFQQVSYLQVGLICLLTPVFMAGAIAQEANPKTWDILLTTPMNSLQIVLGNLFGRLFFVIALLFSSLPLFAITQYFGGVPGDSILSSYAIAGASALLVAAIAVTLSVTRTAGRRAVFIFYITVIMYLFVTYAIDIFLRGMASNQVGTGGTATYTTWMTPLNPFLALEVLLKSNEYVPNKISDAMWLARVWKGNPIGTFCWLCTIISLVLTAFSTIRLRVIGAKIGSIPWYRKVLGLGAKGAKERPPRKVSHNPIAWRESSGRSRTVAGLLVRYGFVALGVALGIVVLILFHTGTMGGGSLRLAIAAILSGEIVIITLIAIQLSATAVSREREDGTLDIILTTPIQPGPYISGKLRGLVQYLVPMMLVPTLTVVIIATYTLFDGFGRSGGIMMSDVDPSGTGTIANPVILPHGALALPLVLPPFVAFCVMVGLQWSIKSKGTISSVISAVVVVVAVVGVLSLCAVPAGKKLSVAGSALVTISPVNLVFAIVYPADTITSALGNQQQAAYWSLVVGAAISATLYIALVLGMHSNMKRTFMMTVRRLAGTS
ncbi:MAG: ABC transporter permease subunit [Planctomycetota bacterium]|jgi:ABC-type transport system involved in multi-copper enzyme maturation permease subunit